LQTVILLAENENELFRLDETETVDGILAVSDLDDLALIEDKIILAYRFLHVIGKGSARLRNQLIVI